MIPAETGSPRLGTPVEGICVDYFTNCSRRRTRTTLCTRTGTAASSVLYYLLMHSFGCQSSVLLIIGVPI